MKKVGVTKVAALAVVPLKLELSLSLSSKYM